MKLEDFHRLVSFELRRGSSLDTMIPLYVKQAVNFMERNAPMKYMEEIFRINLAPDEQQVDLQWNFRNIRWLRYAAGGYWRYVPYLNPRDEEVPGDGPGSVIPTPDGRAIAETPGAPTAFSQVGVRYLRFNNSWRGPGTFQLQGMAYKYTDWQESKTDFKHYLLDVGSDLVLFTTMIRIAASIKDARLAELYKPLRDEAMQTFLSADQDAEYGEARDDAIVYTGLYR